MANPVTANGTTVSFVTSGFSANIVSIAGFDQERPGLDDTNLLSGRVVAAGTAQGGTSTTIQLAVAETFADDALNGMTASITGGTGAGQRRPITDYAGATDTATVSPAWTTAPDGTSTYEILDGGITENIPGEIISQSPIEVTCHWDLGDLPPFAAPETITITLPLGSGQSTAGNLTGTGFITKRTGATLENNNRLTGTFEFVYDGKIGPTWNSGSA